MSDELNQLKVDIALIKKDIRQIERFFNKVEEVSGHMSSINTSLAVQEQYNKSFEEKLIFLEGKIDDFNKSGIESRLALKDEIEETQEKLEHELTQVETGVRGDSDDRTDEILKVLNEMDKKMEVKLESLGTRIRILENWRWYIMGAIGVVVFALVSNSINFAAFLG